VGRDPALAAPIGGPDDVREAVAGIGSAVADTRAEHETVVVEGDRIAPGAAFSGTHEGEYPGIEPTGNEFENIVVAVQRLESGTP